MMSISLFFTFLLIGAVTFGGGYAMLPLFERMIVEGQGWLDRSLFLDMIALSQVTPGPVAINSATFIGFEIQGVVGAFFATTGVVFVPVILITLVSHYQERFKQSKAVQGVLYGLRPALFGLIFASAYSLFQDAIHDIYGVILFIVFSVLLIKFRVHPILIIVISGILGLIIYL